MKKLLLPLLTLAVILSGCDKKTDDEPNTISFEKNAYTVKDTPVTVKISSGYQGPATDIAVTLGGDAVKDEDFTISAEKFVVGGGSQSLEITISPKENYDSDKKLTLTLGSLPAGVEAGANMTATVNVESKSKTMVSFSERDFPMTAKATVKVLLSTLEGGTFVAAEDMVVPVKVDAASENTAVEGTHFKFTGSSELVVAKGQSEGTISLDCIKAETDKDVFYLTIDFGKQYVAGQFDKAKITILGSYGDQIAGEWILFKEVNDKQYFDEYWNGMITTTGFGAADPSDKITIDGDMFNTEMKSFYKDYFGTECDFRLGEEFTLRVGIGQNVQLQLLVMSNINRYFSPTETSEDDLALVGVRVIPASETEAGAEVLEVWIIDYESKAFFPEFYEFGIYDGSKPTAISTGAPLCVQYKKVAAE